jgi:HEAT repeat protein
MAKSTNYRQMVLDTITHALTNDPNPEVRAKAAESLGKLGEAAVTPLLLNALSDSNQTVQVQRHPGIRATWRRISSTQIA